MRARFAVFRLGTSAFATLSLYIYIDLKTASRKRARLQPDEQVKANGLGLYTPEGIIPGKKIRYRIFFSAENISAINLPCQCKDACYDKGIAIFAKKKQDVLPAGAGSLAEELILPKCH